MRTPVVLCIGTDTVSGDALGPIVGDLLTDRYNVNAYVYGRTERTVNGGNFGVYSKFIERMHPKSYVIAVDACVGNREDVGKIKVADGVKAGGALAKNHGKVGNVGILGVVCEKSSDNLFSLMNVDLKFVEELGARIAEKIALVLAAV